jgi:signal transduction histidine kinase
LVAGVAAGVADRFGIDPTIVRVAFLLSSLVSGLGLLAYVVAWVMLPVQGRSGTIASRAVADRTGIVLVLAFVPALVAILAVSSALNVGFLSSFAWSGYFALAGLVLIYRNADDHERAWLHRAAEPIFTLGSRSRRVLILRVLAGAGLAAGGVALFTSGHATQLGHPLGGAALLIAAVVLVFGPWWLRLTRDLVAERQARIRAEERADMAARVHDSVLQTLALIQRSAREPDRIVQLARNQERELRSWLFDTDRASANKAKVGTLSGAVEQLARDVEAAHGVPVDVVSVGDCPIDDELETALAAAREAAVNAAKWSGAPTISVFVEVERKRISLFVRDRGCGFDPTRVPEDRHGISTSIRGRLDRVNGAVSIRSTPGEGTEVELSVPRRHIRS